MSKKKPIRAFALAARHEPGQPWVNLVNYRAKSVRREAVKTFGEPWVKILKRGFRVVPVWISMEPPHE